MKPRRDHSSSAERRIADLEARLEKAQEAEETLRAIRAGEVDAIVVSGSEGERVFTLKGAERPYRVLVEAINEGAATLADDGTIVYCNRRFAEMLGRPLEHVIGSAIASHLPADEADTFAALCRAALRGPAKGQSRLRAAGGMLVPTYLSLNALADDAASLCLVATDLTEQLRTQEVVAAEKLARSVLEQTAEGIVVCDEAGRVIRASRSALALRSGENPLLRRFDEAFPLEPSGLGAVEARPVDVVSSALAGTVVRGVQARLQRRDGVAVQLQVSAAPLASEHGEVIGCVITLADTTERERLLADVERLVSELKQAVAVRDQFISVASHELKTPLTALMLSIDSASRNSEKLRGDGDLFERKLAAVSRQGQRLAGLVGELLDVSRIRTGRLQFKIEEVDLSAVVREVVERHAQEAGWAGCAIELRAEDAVTGAWDRSRLDQVATNLLSNATKYGAGKAISVVVEAIGATARLSVTDRGIGIAPKDQERIFQEFERAVDTGHYGGMGLGLWITREIVARLGGSVRVESALGEGARFVVELPRGG